MYLYESHLGGLYITEDIRSYDELYCETCGDSDWELGEFETLEEFWNLISDEVSIDGSGGLSLQYIFPIIDNLFDYSFLVNYENEYHQDNELCCNSDHDIIHQIKEAIVKEQKNKCVKE